MRSHQPAPLALYTVLRSSARSQGKVRLPPIRLHLIFQRAADVRRQLWQKLLSLVVPLEMQVANKSIDVVHRQRRHQALVAEADVAAHALYFVVVLNAALVLAKKCVKHARNGRNEDSVLIVLVR